MLSIVLNCAQSVPDTYRDHNWCAALARTFGRRAKIRHTLQRFRMTFCSVCVSHVLFEFQDTNYFYTHKVPVSSSNYGTNGPCSTFSIRTLQSHHRCHADLCDDQIKKVDIPSIVLNCALSVYGTHRGNK